MRLFTPAANEQRNTAIKKRDKPVRRFRFMRDSTPEIVVLTATVLYPNAESIAQVDRAPLAEWSGCFLKGKYPDVPIERPF